MTVRTNTFEGGTNGGAATTANSGGVSGDAFTTSSVAGTGIRNYQASGALKGALSLRVTAAATTDTSIFGYDSAFSGVSGTGVRLRFYIMFLADTTANGASILQIRYATGTAANLVMNTGLSLRLNNTLSAPVASTTFTASLSTLYRIEISLDPGTSTVSGKVKIAIYAGDDTASPLITTTQTGQNFNGATITGLRWGKTGTAGSVDYLMDAIAADDTTYGTFIGPVAANQAPSVSVTSPVTIVSGGAASLVSTESDPDGDTITGTWSYLSGPVVVAPAAPSSASTTVTLATPGRYVYRRSVSDGSLTTNADCTIRVTTQPVQVDGTVSNAGGMTAVGSGSLSAALSDSNDGTYGESVSSPVNAVTVHSLAPFTTPTDKSGIKLAVRSRRVGGTTGTSKFELLEGATVRKDFGTQALTTSFADYVLSLDLTSANAITDWSNLSVRQTDNAS